MSSKEIQAISQAGTHDLYINRFNNRLESVSKNSTLGHIWVSLVHIKDTNRVVSRVESIMQKNQAILNDKNILSGLERFNQSLTLSGNKNSLYAERLIATYKKIINPQPAPISPKKTKSNNEYYNIYNRSIDSDLNNIKELLENSGKVKGNNLALLISTTVKKEENFNYYADLAGKPTRDINNEIMILKETTKPN